jgi:hypothetical protein
LLTRREESQLPPENDANPVVWVRLHADGRHAAAKRRPPTDGESFRASRNGEFWIEYWSSHRVRDTLKDSREYDEGGTVGWFVVVGLSFLAGALIF